MYYTHKITQKNFMPKCTYLILSTDFFTLIFPVISIFLTFKEKYSLSKFNCQLGTCIHVCLPPLSASTSSIKLINYLSIKPSITEVISQDAHTHKRKRAKKKIQNNLMLLKRLVSKSPE